MSKTRTALGSEVEPSGVSAPPEKSVDKEPDDSAVTTARSRPRGNPRYVARLSPFDVDPQQAQENNDWLNRLYADGILDPNCRAAANTDKGGARTRDSHHILRPFAVDPENARKNDTSLNALYKEGRIPQKWPARKISDQTVATKRAKGSRNRLPQHSDDSNVVAPNDTMTAVTRDTRGR